MRTALVTGGAGFIGSHLVDILLAEGWHVTVLDNFDPFYPAQVKRQNIKGHMRYERYRLVEADIRDLRQIGRHARGEYDVIVHLAAKAGVRPSIEEPAAYRDVNVRGLHNLLELARRWQIGQFVFASSSSVYGVNPRVPWREDDYALSPISPYASTKISGELLGRVYSRLYGIRFVSLRLFTVYGPRQRPDLAIHKFARLMVAGMPVPIFGGGTSRRDYTYVTDIVEGIRRAMDYHASPYETINLSNNRTVSIMEMVGVLSRVLCVAPSIVHAPEQLGDVPQTWGDIAKARRLLGYTPRTSFEEGVSRFADWLHGVSAP